MSSPNPNRRHFPWRFYLIAVGAELLLTAVYLGAKPLIRNAIGDGIVWGLIPLALGFGLLALFPAIFFVLTRKWHWDGAALAKVLLTGVLVIVSLAAAFVFFFFTCLATIK